VRDVRTDHAHLASPAQRFIAWVLDAAIGGLVISPLLLVRRASGADDGALGASLWFLVVVELVAFALTASRRRAARPTPEP
jgi:integral membrane sensor domain MASE1